ncbi:hypothetical protein OEZ86_009539 [Tetradesmus obliquus]|uniref:Uncharacterized protein n=1 Tax=Tetradesmus obliquus TaxID=3088 RepID=A0ABY8UQ92_TETOB|nr:hypothetical protein OEZ85_000985 [Tetradesmus obliquus]WIA43004.1 hypothetical protein OEZ86_009539 [Tetradesmus obliquus]
MPDAAPYEPAGAPAAAATQASQDAAAAPGAGPEFTRYTFLPARQQQQQQPRTTEQRNAATHRHWGTYQDKLVPLHLESLAEQQEMARSVRSHLAALIQDKCSSAKCPDCGRDGSSPDQLVSCVHDVEVLVMTFTALLSIKVPVYRCGRCNGELFNVHPSYAGSSLSS